MAYDGYLRLGCLDLVSAQAVHYAKTQNCRPNGPQIGLCCACEGLDTVLGHPDGWTTPEPDEAPWWDVTEPLSGGFAGFILNSVSGLGPGHVSRTVSETATEGAVIGRRRQAAPVIVVTGTLVGATCCHTAYGLRWLRAALEGDCSRVGCPGEDLTYLECCPDLPDGATPAQVEAAFAPHWRTMKQVALVSGVDVIQEFGKGCGCGCSPMVRVQFQLAASKPCVFWDPRQVVLEHRLRDGSPLISNCFDWVRVPDGQTCPDPDSCTPAAPCTSSPTCPHPPQPPKPPLVIDSCLSCTPFEQFRTCFDIPPDSFPAWVSGAIGFQIATGSQPLKHVKVTLWQNPLSLPIEELDPCTAFSETNISYIPPFSTFVLDSANRRTLVTCPGGGDIDASDVLGGPPGQLFDYPVVQCGGVNYTMCVEMQGTNPTPAPSAYISVDVTPKEC